jgi:para-nitrobenzyl esterase
VRKRDKEGENLKGKKPTVAAIAATLFGLALAAQPAARGAIGPVVEVEGGSVRGIPARTHDVMVFKGIPYATPPVGDLRWKPPAPVVKWSGVRSAGEFAADCKMPAKMPWPVAPRPTSEDCLYLNLWTPARSATDKLAVMVWIYGSRFLGGSPADPEYDGEALAQKGVILVSMNYRNNVMGFLCHPLLREESPNHSSGNYGMLDLIASLKWIQGNIVKFGGDPGKVTIFGFSSGGESVNLLMASPLAKGLFQRAIGESAGAFGARRPKTEAEAEKSEAEYAAKFGTTVAELRAKPADELMADPAKAEPVIDGWFLPADVNDIFKNGQQNDVRTIVGSNEVEPVQMADLQVTLWATLQARTGKAKVYQYRFTQEPPVGPDGRRGPVHGDEVQYVFHNLNMMRRDWTETDRKVEDIISSYWVNFSKTGDPNGPGLPHWSTLQEQESSVLEINANPHMIPRPNTKQIKAEEEKYY